MTKKYNRVMLKLSGEALAGEKGFGIDQNKLEQVAKQLINVANLGVQVALVVGAGNIWRGRLGENMDRVTADHMGMLATCINALGLQDAIRAQGAKASVMSAVEMIQFADTYVRRDAVKRLEQGEIIIFACGTGNPYFTTDTAAALRAVEIQAEAILLAKNIDGVYDDDPRKNSAAKRFESISYMDALERRLKVMDTTALTLCMDNDITIEVFELGDGSNIAKVVEGQRIGTLLKEDIETKFC